MSRVTDWGALRGAPRRKTSALSHRTAETSATLQRLRRCAPKIPITRVSDLTPLDRLGVPVFSATTPLATDLTTHMGKGTSPIAAEVSAMSEAVERFSAQELTAPILVASYRELRDREHCADPATFELPNDSSYHADLAIHWVEGRDLLGGRAIWIPRDLVISPPQEGILPAVDTNGLAAGNTLLEAVFHAICEIIERDTGGQHLFADLFAGAQSPKLPLQPIDAATLPGSAASLLEAVEAAGLGILVTHLGSDVHLPVLRCVLVDHHYPSGGRTGTRRFVGFGASPNAELAMLRSITEAVQSRLAVIQGARDSYNTLLAPPRFARPEDYLADFSSRHRQPFTAVPTFESEDLLEDLDFVLGALQAAGVRQVVAVDLTDTEVDFPVVRVRIPGLTSFMANRRRDGWRVLRHLL